MDKHGQNRPATHRMSGLMPVILTDSQISDMVSGYRFAYARAKEGNPTGKSYTDFTAADIAKLDTPVLTNLRNMMLAEKYNLTDALLPNNMGRAEFTRATLRELARRNQIAPRYDGFPTFDPKVQSSKISVSRHPFAVDGAVASLATDTVSNIAMRDGLVDIVQNNSNAIRVASDLASKVGLQKPRAINIDTDAEAFDFGYTVGSLPQYKKEDPLKLTFFLRPTREQSARILAEEDALTEGKSPAQVAAMRQALDVANKKKADDYVQRDHCQAIADLFEPGNALSNKEAVLRGFLQARVDGRSSFDSSQDAVGIYGECPISNKRAVSR
jgi:hypothetical protein